MSILSFAKKSVAKKAVTKKETTKPADEKAEAPTIKVGAKLVELVPHVSEASFALQAESNTVVFRVKPGVSKPEISQAVRDQYGFTPLAVRTANFRGKARRRGATTGSTASWKKAWVTLPEGKTIDFST